MECPDCKTPYSCDCEPCVERFGPGWKRSNYTGDDYDETCPGCGKTQSAHLWTEEEYRQYEARRSNDTRR